MTDRRDAYGYLLCCGGYDGHKTGCQLAIAQMVASENTRAADYGGNRIKRHLERRERIATAALQGLLASDHENNHSAQLLARCAVQAADALIAELDGRTKDGEP